MGSNDLCFCGSGLKQKRCHSDIHEKSIIARILRTYFKVDKIIANHYQQTLISPPCKSGCSKCCSDYFTVSAYEFELILYSIKGWHDSEKQELASASNRILNIFKSQYPQIYYYFEQDSTGEKLGINEENMIAHQFKQTCPFLDIDTNSCKIYKYRPMICRNHGTSFILRDSNNLICDIIGSENQARKWQADLCNMIEEISDINCIKVDKNNSILSKRYPLFYLLAYRYSIKNDLSLGNEQLLFRSSENTLSEYLKK